MSVISSMFACGGATAMTGDRLFRLRPRCATRETASSRRTGLLFVLLGLVISDPRTCGDGDTTGSMFLRIRESESSFGKETSRERGLFDL